MTVLDLRQAKVLVVGGSGFIGRHVSALLAARGARVRVLDMVDPAFDAGMVEWMAGSIEDVDRVRQAIEDRTHVIFLAAGGLPADRDRALSDEISGHVVQPLRFAAACARAGVGHFIFASSGGTVYGANGKNVNSEVDACRPINAYAASKLACENYLRVLGVATKMKTISLRISNPYGEGQIAKGQGFIAAALQFAHDGKPIIIWGDGTVVRDFVHVEDVARAFAAACVYAGHKDTFNIGYGKGLALIEVLRQITDLGIPVEHRFEPGRAGDIAVNVLDISRARNELGWEPRVSFEDGLARTAGWWSAGKAPGRPD